jgi:hypothetical protein
MKKHANRAKVNHQKKKSTCKSAKSLLLHLHHITTILNANLFEKKNIFLTRDMEGEKDRKFQQQIISIAKSERICVTK